MDDVTPLLAQPHLSLITKHVDPELMRIHDLIEHKMLVDGRGELEELLGRLLAARSGGSAPPVPKTLDLIGHSTPGSSLLMLGNWVIDAASATVTAFFRELAEQDVLPRLGIHAMRLLGCQTADTGQGRATICALANILMIEVYGTTRLIYSAHYDRSGFKDECEHALVCASDLRHDSLEGSRAVLDAGSAAPRVLDIDALPASPLPARQFPWPRRIANPEAAHSILRLVRRGQGAQMPGLLSVPFCEIALPSAKPNWFHLAQILLDGQFVRVYPDGDRKPGIVYPVDDPHALRTLVDGLPVALAS